MNEIKDGEFVVYYDNGNVWYEGEYKNGKRVGIWRWYDEVTGEIEIERNYPY